MQSCLPPRAYSSQAVFEREQALWEEQWQFAGFVRDLKQHHNFVTIQIGRRPVVIQNFDGHLKAFDNVCSHRFSRIQTEPCGNRALQCKYHGWAYNESGDPVGIPKRPRFDGLEELPPESLRLPAWRLETLGDLVFITRSRTSPELRTFLGETYERLKVIAESFGTLLDVNRISIKANWKVVVENTLEAYHVGFVHADNFKKVLADESEFKFELPHSWWHSKLRDNVARAMAPIGRMLKSRKYQPTGYEHLLLFPNVTVATTLGLTFAIQHFIPISVDETEFVSYVFGTAVGDEDADKLNIIQTVNDSAVKFNREIFEEDRVVVEQVQLGIDHAERPGLLSDEEVRVQEFQKAYIERFDFINS